MPKVLVVDDDDGFRQSIVLICRAAGYEAVGACDGAEAIEQLSAGLTVSAIITDVNMPEVNGIEFLIWLKKSRIGEKQIPCLIHSNEETHVFRCGVSDSECSINLPERIKEAFPFAQFALKGSGTPNTIRRFLTDQVI